MAAMPHLCATRHLLLLACACASLVTTSAQSYHIRGIAIAIAGPKLATPSTTALVPAAAADPASDRLPSQDELGITYTALHGMYPLTNISLILHLWMRRVLIDGFEEVRGFGWLEGVGTTDLQKEGHWIQPKVADWTPQLQLQHLPAMDLVNFTMQIARHGPERTFGFSVRVPADSYCIQVFDASIVKLHPSGAWEPATSELCLSSFNACPLFTGSSPSGADGTPSPGPHAWNVLPVFHYASTANIVELYTRYANVLAHNVIYHHHMGFAGTLQYVSPLARHIISMHPTVELLIKKGWLKLVGWESLQVLARTAFVNHAWDHAIINQHAVLGSLRCKDTITALVDVDEFFHTPGPHHTFQEAYSSCFTRRPDNVSVGNRTGWVLERVNIKIEASFATAETSLWVKTTPDLLRMDNHPLRLYDSIENAPEDQGKQLAASSGNGAGYEIHENVRNPDEIRLRVPTECAFFMHVLSMWESRYGMRKWTRRFKDVGVLKYVAMLPLPVFSAARAGA